MATVTAVHAPPKPVEPKIDYVSVQLTQEEAASLFEILYSHTSSETIRETGMGGLMDGLNVALYPNGAAEHGRYGYRFVKSNPGYPQNLQLRRK